MAGRNPGAGTMKPPRPMIGSIITAATLWLLPNSTALQRAGGKRQSVEPVAQRVTGRDPVDSGLERPERLLCQGMFFAVMPIVRLVRP